MNSLDVSRAFIFLQPQLKSGDNNAHLPCGLVVKTDQDVQCFACSKSIILYTFACSKSIILYNIEHYAKAQYYPKGEQRATLCMVCLKRNPIPEIYIFWRGVNIPWMYFAHS